MLILFLVMCICVCVCGKSNAHMCVGSFGVQKGVSELLLLELQDSELPATVLRMKFGPPERTANALTADPSL